jgi:adenylate cyclase
VGGQLADICVLFSDVRDFTTLSEKMPPEIVTAVLQRYFDRMVRAVHKFNGTVDKFIGDGLMVPVRRPRKSTDACGDAVRCALEMMSELDALNAEFQREGTADVDHRNRRKLWDRDGGQYRLVGAA